jgi:hypothetical protein
MTTAPLLVTEIIRRLDQGVTRPFLVRAEDDALYVAKGREATRPGLIAEWLCGHLARNVGLAVPEFSLLEVPRELIEAFGPEGGALGTGIVFGSRQEADVQEFAITQLKHIDKADRQRLLAFDWWVENGDRSLSPHGGNPNLLWRAAQSRLLVIDHNLAFDPEFDEAAFFETHVFRDDFEAVFGDLVCQAELSALLSAALGCFNEAASKLPTAWHWIDLEQTLPVQVDLASIKERLENRAALVRGGKT